MKELIKKLKINRQIDQVTALGKEVKDIIPADQALILHVKFWQVKTILSDIVIKAKRYEIQKKLERDFELVDLQSECNNDDYRSEAAKERYAKSQDSWRNLQKQTKEAEALREWLELKRDDFTQAIYVTKTVLDQEHQDRRDMPKNQV